MGEQRRAPGEADAPRFQYVGGPTLLIEWNGLRLLTDPTFDPAGTRYATPAYTLRKTLGPALPPTELGELDAVLLSHDHHFDNLDRLGRSVATRAKRVLTTVPGAERLGGRARGLEPWEGITLAARDGRLTRVVATPGRHGPADGDRGPVIGFALIREMDPPGAPVLYVAGDTVWYEGLRDVAHAFSVGIAVLFFGAAKVAVAGDQPLTLTGGGGVEAARAFKGATIVPVHYEGWAHFSEARENVEAAFASAGLADVLRWLAPGQPTALSFPDAPRL